ncbi:MAG: hypothetical protein JRF62_04495 [Deltaproteobacteria bacterium]|nr:hypothetical protein [Deltaproteobacteria bacterium]MBW2639840.1 hypothetical protein [Deltaproteobacteria bacterium]MBW2680046.1 hypothetical protein [Deltaproteobacteria bacterium]
MKTQYNILFVMLSFLLFGPLNLVKPSWAATPADHSIYAVLLEKHVKQGHVDYQGFKAKEDLKKELEAKRSKIKIKYLYYDWSLNAY